MATQDNKNNPFYKLPQAPKQSGPFWKNPALAPKGPKPSSPGGNTFSGSPKNMPRFVDLPKARPSGNNPFIQLPQGPQGNGRPFYQNTQMLIDNPPRPTPRVDNGNIFDNIGRFFGDLFKGGESRPRNQTSNSLLGGIRNGGSQNRPDAAQEQRRFPKPSTPGGNTFSSGEYSDGGPVGGMETGPSPLEILMEKLNQPYQGMDPSQIDFSALDKALQTRMDMLSGARNQIQGNFNQSDQNLEAMHRAFENDIRTRDAARFNEIADTQKANIGANIQQGVSALEGDRARAVAERQAMLKNLGIEAAGAAEDPGVQALNNGISNIQQRGNIHQNLAEGSRGSNLAYNNTVAQSVGQQGVARRSALQQQLAGLLGKVDMAESEAKAQDAMERQRTISGANDQGYNRYRDEQKRNLDLFDILTREGIARDKMAMPGEETRPKGLGAVAFDLESSGVDPADAQRGMAALSQILSEGNYLEGANGPQGTTPYDRANILIAKLKGKGVDPMTATQIGTSYSNL